MADGEEARLESGANVRRGRRGSQDEIGVESARPLGHLLRIRDPLPDETALVIFAHLVGLGRKGQAIALKRYSANAILTPLAGRQRVPDVVRHGRRGLVRGPRAEVRIVAVDGCDLF